MTENEIYAITTGTYVGKVLCFQEENEYGYHFLLMPDMNKFSITKELWDNGIEGGAVEFVETVPEYVAQVIKEQYKNLG